MDGSLPPLGVDNAGTAAAEAMADDDACRLLVSDDWLRVAVTDETVIVTADGVACAGAADFTRVWAV